jgi:apolipoprotein N-acyltransferase
VNWTLVFAAAVGLCAAAPPAWVPGGGVLVFVGWAAFYALVTEAEGKRRKRAAYLVGLAHMLWFSFSLRHVMLPAYLAVGLIGGLYYVLTAVWTGALGRLIPRSIAFGLALAGVHWLRAHFVEIQYPHVQPAHCLYEWPVLLGGLGWGGEIFVNTMIGVVAAATVDLYRAWRVGEPSPRRSGVILLVAGVGYGLALIPVGAQAVPTETVRMLLFEPRIRPFVPPQTRVRLMVERVVRPTLELAGPRSVDPPDLVVWPESIAVHRVTGTSARPVVHPVPRSVPWLFALAPGTRLIEGGILEVDGGDPKVIALMVDDYGRYVGHHEKQNVVPGGEHQPFLGFLPRAWSDAVRRWFESAMGVYLPETAAGSPRPLLETASGVRFGVMICYDNAFPGVAEDLAARGAAFLLVISNENWYRGGGELQQMVAMTVCRALESGIPVVRCTVDGASVVIGADGRQRHGLPYPPASYDAGEKLEVELRVPTAGHGAVPWLRPPVTWIVLLSLLSLLAPLRRSWVRIERSKSPPDAAAKVDPVRPVSGP